jgi:hypothetical protein
VATRGIAVLGRPEERINGARISIVTLKDTALGRVAGFLILKHQIAACR